MRAAVSGATGFIGKRLLEQLTRPVVLTRDPRRAASTLGNIEAHAWDPIAGPPPLEALRGLDAVFHLAGDPVADGRWTEEKKCRIRDSRVLGTRHLVESLSRLPQDERPKVLVSASAVGYYGDRGDDLLTED
ncbi:MAG TPA: NAD-dependent epimerase/dehydratase family protein, partial [Pirellulales bacterium]